MKLSEIKATDFPIGKFVNVEAPNATFTINNWAGTYCVVEYGTLKGARFTFRSIVKMKQELRKYKPNKNAA